jgi:hypothetical protein
MFEMDKIYKALEIANKEFKAKNLSSEQTKELNEKLSFKPSEYALFQETKTLFYSQGLISIQTTQWIYNRLSHYSECTLSEKYILNALFAQFLQLKAKLN